ncbi:MAG: DUF308 domain-containing protein [Burkholderia gladioli]
MIDRQAAPALASAERWLKHYYFLRVGFSVVWIALAFTLGRQAPAFAAVLLVIYPAWDAAANYLDLSRSGGGFANNRPQAINVLMSTLITVAVVIALPLGLPAVLYVFGTWAIVSGLPQLVTALGRWKRFGAQWPMILSGAQSALVGALLIAQAETITVPAIVKVAGYASGGAVYFLISAVWLQVQQSRRAARQAC